MRGQLWVRKNRTVPKIMADALLALAALSLLPLVFYGPRAGILLLSGILGACGAEALRGLLFRKQAFDGSAVVTGMIVALLLPAAVPVWMPAAGAFAGVLVGKLPIGRGGRNLLNPAAFGLAGLTLCWPKQVFGYCALEKLPLLATCQVNPEWSPGAFLKAGMKPEILPYDLLWGQYPGPMGAGFAVMLAACAAFFVLRRDVRLYVPVVLLGTAAIVAAIFPRFSELSALASVKYELLSGSLLFCAVFLAADPVTSPRTAVGSVCFAVVIGAFVMAYRWFGSYEEGTCFAILFGNLLSPVLDGIVCTFRERPIRCKAKVPRAQAKTADESTV